MFIYYEDMKGNENVEIVFMGVGVTQLTQGHRQHNILIERIRLHMRL